MPHEINHSYKAVIFDMDGTVLDTLSELTHSLNHIFRLHQMPELPPQEVRLCLGYGYTGLIERAAPSVPADEQALLAEEFKQYYSAHCQGNTRPYDGVADMLAALRNGGYKTAIVSNKGQGAVSLLHDEFFRQLVDFSIGESPQYRKKPAPDMIEKALHLLNCRPESRLRRRFGSRQGNGGQRRPDVSPRYLGLSGHVLFRKPSSRLPRPFLPRAD